MIDSFYHWKMLLKIKHKAFAVSIIINRYTQAPLMQAPTSARRHSSHACPTKGQGIHASNKRWCDTNCKTSYFIFDTYSKMTLTWRHQYQVSDVTSDAHSTRRSHCDALSTSAWRQIKRIRRLRRRRCRRLGDEMYTTDRRHNPLKDWNTSCERCELCEPFIHSISNNQSYLSESESWIPRVYLTRWFR